jgi:UDP-N-acetylmuramate--alanine ligase
LNFNPGKNLPIGTMSKLRIGIIFGGRSKEREISFAGGRTVYDNLNKSLFEAVPLFVDSFGNFVLLDWQFVYKGTIRDFYPPVDQLPSSNTEFQLYAENLGDLDENSQDKLIAAIGKKVRPYELKNLVDFAFLCLHGPYGEDGKIQGLFEYLNIPYSGSGILPSAIGIDKSVQKKLMVQAGFNSPSFFAIDRKHWLSGNSKIAFESAKEKIGFPMVIKPANQGSSIGVTILSSKEEKDFNSAIEKALFIGRVQASDWNNLSEKEKIEQVRHITDIREGIGMPIRIHSGKKEWLVHDPNELLTKLTDELKSTKEVLLESLDGESTVLVEGFIEGKEFSCIVIEDENEKAIALPPTEIRKGKELFDYRSKYMPGLSRKITPIDLPDDQINAIRKECEKLFYALNFDVYARIDGFLGKDGRIFLNDPNTTSGMMPSSFFFHQAAEIGLNPSQFLTFIIRTSFSKRVKGSKGAGLFDHLLKQLDDTIHNEKQAATKKIQVAVILGGYSSERHISVESGRNIYEKLASSEKYKPMPVFLTGDANNHLMYKIPVNLLLKDNADDIKEKINTYKVHPIIKQIIKECNTVTEKYSSPSNLEAPQLLSYKDLAEQVEQVFIALHGRPGEDGSVQEKLEQVGLTYNGSDKSSSEITIDKYKTNEILMKHGLLAAKHMLITKTDWEERKAGIQKTLQEDYKYPFIAKPVDDGCSSAVKKIKSFEEFEAFAKLIFRPIEELDLKAAETLHIKPKEEFPQKQIILVEELISKRGAKHFLEITGGMLTKFNSKGEVEYEVFEASEALAEGDILSLEEKFLAGQGQNITPARYSKDPAERQALSDQVKAELKKAAKALNVTGYCRIDAFVRVFDGAKAEVIFIEVNSLPGMTPATCIYHQAAINKYKPYDFIDRILDFGAKRKMLKSQVTNS